MHSEQKKIPQNATPPCPIFWPISFRPHAAHWSSVTSVTASSTACRANDCQKGLNYLMRPAGKHNHSYLYTSNTLHLSHPGMNGVSLFTLHMRIFVENEDKSITNLTLWKTQITFRHRLSENFALKVSFTQNLPIGRRESELLQAWMRSSILHVLRRRLQDWRREAIEFWSSVVQYPFQFCDYFWCNNGIWLGYRCFYIKTTRLRFQWTREISRVFRKKICKRKRIYVVSETIRIGLLKQQVEVRCWSISLLNATIIYHYLKSFVEKCLNVFPFNAVSDAGFHISIFLTSICKSKRYLWRLNRVSRNWSAKKNYLRSASKGQREGKLIHGSAIPK